MADSIWDPLSGALQDPNVMGALGTFGLNLMQPPQWGDTAASQIARAIGAGGEAAARGQKQQEEEATAEAKTRALEARAAAAGAGAEARGAKAETALEKFNRAQERQELGQFLGEQARYNAMKRRHQEATAKAASMREEPPPPLPTLRQYLHPKLHKFLTPEAGAPAGGSSEGWSYTPLGD